MLVNFMLVQFVPGGPIEQIIAGLESDASVFIAGGAGEIRDVSKAESYLGSKGLPEDFIKELEVRFGFDKPH